MLNKQTKRKLRLNNNKKNTTYLRFMAYINRCPTANITPKRNSIVESTMSDVEKCPPHSHSPELPTKLSIRPIDVYIYL